MNASTRTHRGGFAMIVALSVLALVAVAVTLVLQLATEDVRRTIADRRDTQDRLLLLAGLRVASARLAAGETLQPGAIAVSGETGTELKIDAVESPAADRTMVTMTAGLVTQRATFVRAADGAWTLDRTQIARGE
jgi:hypothetical protein